MFFYHLLTAYIIKCILHDAEKLWVQSDMMLQNATGFLKKAPQKVEKIPNGCDPDLYKPPPAKKPLQDGLELFFAGRLTRQKRPERLIETARILKNEGVVFNLIIAGDGSMKPKLEEITSRYGLTGNVHFTGWISKEKVREYYSQSHVLLAPSEAEGMSITILEALFCGLYVISTPVSGNPDLIEPGLNGELVKNKPGDFAKAVKNFLKQDSKMAKERKDQLEAFREKYSWYHIVKQYEKGISDVIG